MNNLQLLYSKEIINKISNIRVLVLGADTVGQESIRCLSLLGVKYFIITDPTPVTNKYSNRLINFKTSEKLNTLAKYSISLAKQINPDVYTKELGKVSYSTLSNLFQMDEYRPDIILYTCDYIISIADLEKLSVEYSVKYIVGLNNSLFGYIYSYFGKYFNTVSNISFPKNFLTGYKQINNHMLLCNFQNNSIPNDKIVKLKTISTEILVEIVERGADQSIYFKCTPELLAFININSNVFIANDNGKSIDFKQFSEHIVNKNYDIFSLSNTINSNQLYENYTSYIKKPSMANKFFETYAMDSRFYPLSKLIGSLVANETIKLANGLAPLEKDLLFNLNDVMGKNIAKSSRNHAIDYDLHINIDRELLHSIKNKYITVVDLDPISTELVNSLAIMGFCQSKSSLINIINYSQVEDSSLKNQIVNSAYKSSIKFTNNIELDNDKVFSYNYWNGQDLLVCSSNNSYKINLDQIATEYSKPFLEISQTNINCYVPNKTNTYIDNLDFSSNTQLEHITTNYLSSKEDCIKYAIEQFKLLFETVIDEYTLFIGSRENYISYIRQQSNCYIKKHIELLIIFLELLVDPQAFEFIEKIYNYIFIYPINDLLESKDIVWGLGKYKPNIVYFNNLLEEYPNYISTIYSYIDNNIIQLPKYNIDMAKNYTSIYKDDYVYNYNPSNSEIEELISMLDMIEIPEDLEPIPSIKIDSKHLDVIYTMASINSLLYNLETVDYVDVYRAICPCSYDPISVSISASIATCEAIQYFNNKKPHRYIVDTVHNIYRVMEMPKPIDIYNGMYSKVLNTNISTIPECFDRWKNIHINCVQDSCYTLTSLINILDSDYGIVAREISINKTIIYSDIEKSYIDKNLENILFGLAIRKSKNIAIQVIPLEKEGRPTVTPPIYISLN